MAATSFHEGMQHLPSTHTPPNMPLALMEGVSNLTRALAGLFGGCAPPETLPKGAGRAW